MNEVTPINTHAAVMQRIEATRVATQLPTPTTYTGSDSVEISAVATLMAQMDELPDVREDLVLQIRHQITAGTYDIDSKIDGILERIAEDL